MNEQKTTITSETESEIHSKETVNSVQEEHWFKSYWRPAAAWTYLVICLFDFMLAPIMMGVFSFATKVAYIAWVPLTTAGGAIFHLSFGAILGISAWGRTKEKISGAEDSTEDKK